MPSSKEQEHISVQDCLDGWLYRIASRDLNLGVYRSSDHAFFGIRHETGARFLYSEIHVDCGPPYGTAKPFEKICRCPLSKLDEFLDERVNGNLVENVTLFEWIDEQGRRLGVLPESC
jgi:hypothetical protein